MPTKVNVFTILNGGFLCEVCSCLDFLGNANNFFDLTFVLLTPSLLRKIAQESYVNNSNFFEKNLFVQILSINSNKKKHK